MERGSAGCLPPVRPPMIRRMPRPPDRLLLLRPAFLLAGRLPAR